MITTLEQLAGHSMEVSAGIGGDASLMPGEIAGLHLFTAIIRRNSK
jgi:hypothetical protein